MEYRSNRFIPILKAIEPFAIPAGTFFVGLGTNNGNQWAWVCAGVAFGAELIIRLSLKACDVDETPILQLSHESAESEN